MWAVGWGGPPPIPADPRQEGSERSPFGSVTWHLVLLSPILVIFPAIVLCSTVEMLVFVHV